MSTCRYFLMNLPAQTPPAALVEACAKRFQSALEGAAGGDSKAQRELVALRVAYLNWAYVRQNANPHQFPLETDHHGK
jgi:hypothetical protein